MKIVLIGGIHPLFGGVERIVETLARALTARGAEVLCIANGPADAPLPDWGAPMIMVPMAAALDGGPDAALQFWWKRRYRESQYPSSG